MTAPVIPCAGDDRRNAVADNAAKAPNGIDFVEVVPAPVAGDPPTLTLTFVFPAPTGAARLKPTNFAVAGGERIVGVAVTGVAPHPGDARSLDLTLSEEGDFSTYTLYLRTAADDAATPAGFDPQLRAVAFHFHVECPARFDCKRDDACPPPPAPPINIDYLAKDYETFRKLMLDRLSLLAPGWAERNAADAGVAMVELIAYAADRLSYRQDAAATEAYLATARLRTSVCRHARLVDYDMHDGCNARAWLQVRVSSSFGTPANPAVAAGTRFCTTLAAAPSALANTVATFQQIAQAGAQVFEAMGPVQTLAPAHNAMALYNWSSTDCCLPVGATRATLAGAFPDLVVSQPLVLAEVKGPETGDPEDADPRCRQAVRLTRIEVTTDPLTQAAVTNIWWDVQDALTATLCIATTVGSGEESVAHTAVSAALGNLVLVDHGRSLGSPVEALPVDIAAVTAGRRFWPRLPVSFVTYAQPSPLDASGLLTVSATAAAKADPTQATPVLSIESVRTIPNALGGPPTVQVTPWTAVRALFDPAVRSSPHALVVEVETDGGARLRFGDGTDGAKPDAGDRFRAAAVRLGDMGLGLVGAETLTHIVGGSPQIDGVSNPLPAFGGAAPETVASARAAAPYAFRTQKRAVTLADYEATALSCPTVPVIAAVAVNRLTRSWRTVFVAVELADGAVLDEAGRAKLIDWFDTYRMAGLDVEVENAKRVALELVLHVCVDPSYRRDVLEQALLTRFSDKVLADGSRGVFHPDNFLIGKSVYLSPMVAAAQRLPGVVSVEAVTFQRSDRPVSDGLTDGYLTPGRGEVFVLRNNPDLPEQGVFTLQTDGGR